MPSGTYWQNLFRLRLRAHKNRRNYLKLKKTGSEESRYSFVNAHLCSMKNVVNTLLSPSLFSFCFCVFSFLYFFPFNGGATSKSAIGG